MNVCIIVVDILFGIRILCVGLDKSSMSVGGEANPNDYRLCATVRFDIVAGARV